MGLGHLVNTMLAPLGLRLYRSAGGAHRSGFSRQDEEAILAELVEELRPTRHFVDIGAGDGIKDSNTARLAFAGWRGEFFECDHERLSVLAANYRDVEGVSLSGARVTPENVAALLDGHGVAARPGVVSLDIDSYDGAVLEALLERFRPTIIVAEINEKIPPPLDFAVRFDPAFRWDGGHFYGQSIMRLHAIARERNYSLDRLEYNNAFLVDAEVSNRAGLSAEEAYRMGYVERPDRKTRFPWNADVEGVLRMQPEDAVAFFDRRFAAYAGRYDLSIARPEGA